MRMLLKWEMGLEAANDAIRSGRIDELNKALMERTQPEAAYFCTENGARTSYVFFDLADPSQIPVIAEPLFRHLHANVQFIPAMNADELQQGLTEAGGS